MSLSKAERIKGVKVRRADQRLADLQRSRRQLQEAEEAFAAAEAEVETFKQERLDAMQTAYEAIRGEVLTERDLRNLNQKLDRLVEQEKTLIHDLSDHRKAIAAAEGELQQSVVRFHAAHRNREKWERMVGQIGRGVRRETERLAENERDDNSRAKT